MKLKYRKTRLLQYVTGDVIAVKDVPEGMYFKFHASDFSFYEKRGKDIYSSYPGSPTGMEKLSTNYFTARRLKYKVIIQ